MTEDGKTLQVEQVELAPCPWCEQRLTIRGGVNPYGRCDTEGCWMHERAVSVPLDEPRQVAQWNTRLPTNSVDVEQRARELPNIVDRARALIVHVLDRAAIKYGPDHGSYKYLAGMAQKVKAAEATAIDSYLVLDCVIAALSGSRLSNEGVREALREARDTLAVYADPVGYYDNFGEPYSEGESHPGSLAANVLVRIDSALASLQPASLLEEPQDLGGADAQPAGAPSGPSLQAVSGKAAHQAQGD